MQSKKKKFEVIFSYPVGSRPAWTVRQSSDEMMMMMEMINFKSMDSESMC